MFINAITSLLLIFNFVFLSAHAMKPSFDQTSLNTILQTIHTSQQCKEEHSKIFNAFLLSDTSVFQDVDFNIKNITALSKAEPINRPGLAPDWGTSIFEGMVFENLTFEKCHFNWLNFCNAVFKNVTFINCSFEWALFDAALLENVTFTHCNLKDASFVQAELNHVVFHKTKALYVNFGKASLTHTSYIDNQLYGSIFFDARASNLYIQGNTDNVLFHHLRNSQIDKPVVLISWNNKNPGLAGMKSIKKIQELGGIPFKFNYKDPGIDKDLLKKEVDHIVCNLQRNPRDEPLPKQILDAAKQGDFPQIANIQKQACAWSKVVSHVLLPGGEDVQPFFYNKKPHPKTSLSNDLRREIFEFAILDEMMPLNTPILGICRGLQVSNIFLGGTLHQHIEGHLYVPQTYHLVSQEPNSILAPLFLKAPSFVGYSFHHQAADLIGKGLTPIAVAEDGTIKALEKLGKRFMVLVQWHPEYKGDLSTPESEQLNHLLSPGNEKLFETFLNAGNS